MNRDREFSPAEIQHMRLAGMPADRPNMLGEYPKMLYRAGTPKEGTHHLASTIDIAEPLPIQGRTDIETMVVADEEEELRAMEQGWKAKVSQVEEPAKSKRAA